MRIAEIYSSIQGEGRLTGTSSVFVRASGCNLRCHYCDTPHTSWHPEGDDMSVKEIADAVTKFDCEYIVLTGGEPMLFAELVPLCHQLKKQGRHITIETAGTLFLPVSCDLMSISPKLSNSTPHEASPRWAKRHESSRHAPDVIRDLTNGYSYQLKFVIAEESDLDDVLEYLKEFPHIDRDHVMLMPEGTSQDRLLAIGRWLEPLCDSHRFQYCPRRHIEWFGAKRGT